jgi:hypothetical protein
MDPIQASDRMMGMGDIRKLQSGASSNAIRIVKEPNSAVIIDAILPHGKIYKHSRH